jgi:hypothetical protein
MQAPSYGTVSPDKRSGRQKWGGGGGGVGLGSTLDDWDDFDISMSFPKKPAAPMVTEQKKTSNVGFKPQPRRITGQLNKNDDDFFALVLVPILFVSVSCK